MGTPRSGHARSFTTNWSANVPLQASAVVHPRREGEIVHYIARARARGEGLRAIGAGHSFSTVVQAAGTLLTLEHLRGLIEVDAHTGDATFRAGTRLREIGPALRAHGRALENLGDIDAQSIAGAISTGTHGTGATFPGLSAMVTGLRIALASGDVVWADQEHNPRLFQAARLGLGAYGILTEVRLRTVPYYLLSRSEYTKPLDEAIVQFIETSAAHDHEEFFWSPGASGVVMRDLDHVSADAKRRGPGRVRNAIEADVVGNGAFTLANRLARAVPGTSRPLRSLLTNLMPASPAVGDPSAIFAQSRRVRFRETELALPVDRLGHAFEALTRAIERSGTHLIFPLEIRRAARDDVWLSTAYERDVCYIAAHIPVAEPSDDFLRLIHDTLAPFEARPHWGKMHWMSGTELEALYPRMGEARAVREDVDPERIFGNPYVNASLMKDGIRA